MNRARTLTVTPRVRDWLANDRDREAWIADCLRRHHRRDWGDVERDDWAAHDRAVALQAGRLLSAYQPGRLPTPDSGLWIITDDLGDPSPLTTILWPSDYARHEALGTVRW